MANSSVTALVNRQSVALALRDARAKCAASQRWLNAVNRAALNLESCRWSFDGEALKVESATNSNTYYTVTVESCECKAGQKGEPCWHRAGCRLLIKAAEMNGTLSAQVPTTVEVTGPSMVELQAAADELFG